MPDEKLPRFGASDFFLTDTDPVVVREKLRSTLSELLGRTVVDADPHMVLASAFMPYLVQGLASIDACAKATLRAYATGVDLDRVADSTCVVGYLNRKPARPAILPLLLELEVAHSSGSAELVGSFDWSLEYEAPLENGDTVKFSGSGSVENIKFSLDEELVYVAVPIYLFCERSGPDYNGLGDDVLIRSQALIDAIELTGHGAVEEFDSRDVYFCGETYGGSDAEDDASFAQRVAWQAKALRVPGSYEAFKLLLSELNILPSTYVSPDVDDLGRIVMAWVDKVHYLGGLTYDKPYLVKTPGDGYLEFLHAVQGSLMVSQHAYAYKAEPYDTTAHIGARYKLPADTPDIEAAKKAVEKAFNAWRTSVSWRCGAVIYASDAAAAISSAGGVEVYAWSENGGSPGSPLPPNGPLPADRFMMGAQFTIEYIGTAEQNAPAAGGQGEDITPL